MKTRSLLLSIVLTIVVTALIVSYAWYHGQSTNHDARGHAFYKDKRYAEAATEYQQAIDWSALCSSEDIADMYCDLGDARDMAGQLDLAVAAYSEALRRQPTRSRYFYERAIAYRRSRQYEKAVADMDSAIRLQDGRPYYFFERAVSEMALDRYKAVVADLDRYRATVKPPEPYGRNYRSYDLRGWAHYKLGEMPEALADFNAALGIKPDYAQAWHDRGDLHAAQGHDDLARNDYAQARKLGYGSPTPSPSPSP